MEPDPLGHALAHPFLCTWLLRDPAYQRPGAGGRRPLAQFCALAERKYESLFQNPGFRSGRRRSSAGLNSVMGLLGRVEWACGEASH